ncbi:unnamed protein product, partial [Ectocarpus fasciculatus]
QQPGDEHLERRDRHGGAPPPALLRAPRHGENLDGAGAGADAVWARHVQGPNPGAQCVRRARDQGRPRKDQDFRTGGSRKSHAPGGVSLPTVQGDHFRRGGHDDAGRAVGATAHDGNLLHGEK